MFISFRQVSVYQDCFIIITKSHKMQEPARSLLFHVSSSIFVCVNFLLCACVIINITWHSPVIMLTRKKQYFQSIPPAMHGMKSILDIAKLPFTHGWHGTSRDRSRDIIAWLLDMSYLLAMQMSCVLLLSFPEPFNIIMTRATDYNNSFWWVGPHKDTKILRNEMEIQKYISACEFDSEEESLHCPK